MDANGLIVEENRSAADLRLFEAFQTESNRIEGIQEVTPDEVQALIGFTKLPELTIANVSDLALIYTKGYGLLRRHPGMNVSVGNHRPPFGGPEIVSDLMKILYMANEGPQTSRGAYEVHHAYETLHPFRDGNGRTGRAIFLWQELRADRRRVLHIGFAIEWYFRSLECGR